MLTTSRREVTVDNIENESKEKLTFNDSALAREKYDFSGESSFEEPSYFSNTEKPRSYIGVGKIRGFSERKRLRHRRRQA